MKRTLAFLGPRGSFTHLAASRAQELLQKYHIECVCEPVDTAQEIFETVESGDGWGIIAWDNTVEGVVVPNLDLLMNARSAAGLLRLSVPITFDAFVSQETAQQLGIVVSDTVQSTHSVGSQSVDTQSVGTPHTSDNTMYHNTHVLQTPDIAGYASTLYTVHAHPHGLAQCRTFIQQYHVKPVAAPSNAAACRDLQFGQVALGPSICAELYNVVPIAHNVQDFSGAHTDFIVIAPREEIMQLHTDMALKQHVESWESIVACAPLSTGAGVLADLLDGIRDAGLNMTSFMSRPIRGCAGTYSFIITMDAAPWEASCAPVLRDIVDHGDWLKTLAVYPRAERPNPPVETWALPEGGICTRDVSDSSMGQFAQLTQLALLWE